MIDPITTAVLSSAMRATAFEMSEALQRSSHSPIIREMLDFSCALFTAAGETVAQDDNIPSFLGTMAVTIPWVIEAAGEDLDPEDVFLTNDPYRGGTHTPDLQVFVPVFAADQLIGWAGNIAHHSDVGGPNPGTEGFSNRSMFAEGLRIPPVRLVDAGRWNRPLHATIENNIRDPESTSGDLRAQVAAAKLGRRRLLELVAAYSAGEVVESMEILLDQSERRLRSSIGRRPDGTASAEGYLDNGGIGDEPVKIAATVTVAGEDVRVSLAGSDPQVEGSLNMSQAASRSAVFFAVKAIFDPGAPHNSGLMRPIEIDLPEGTVANPRFPAAVSLRHLSVLRLADILIAAFSQLYSDIAVGGAFVGFSSLSAACRHPLRGQMVVIQDDVGGGMGGHIDGDGKDAVDIYLGNVKMLPAEICELQYPVRIRETSLVDDSAGPGEFRGGLGIKRVYEFLDEADGVFYSEQTNPDFAPRGVNGGGSGDVARLTVERANGEIETVGKARLSIRKGDRMVIVTGGGGGYGDPLRRDREKLRRDLAEGKVTPAGASPYLAPGESLETIIDGR